MDFCHRALGWILSSHHSKAIPRFWLDHPDGEEGIAVPEEQRLPVFEQFLPRSGEKRCGDQGWGPGRGGSGPGRDGGAEVARDLCKSP